MGLHYSNNLNHEKSRLHCMGISGIQLYALYFTPSFIIGFMLIDIGSSRNDFRIYSKSASASRGASLLACEIARRHKYAQYVRTSKKTAALSASVLYPLRTRSTLHVHMYVPPPNYPRAKQHKTLVNASPT